MPQSLLAVAAQTANGYSEHGAFGTVALQLDGIPPISPRPGVRATPRQLKIPSQAGTLTADLVRRDFTINAMAFDLLSGELIDYHHIEDLVYQDIVFCMGAASRPFTGDSRRYHARGFTDWWSAVSRSSIIWQWPWAWTHGDTPLSSPPALHHG